MLTPNAWHAARRPVAVGLTLVALGAASGCSFGEDYETREVERGDFGTDWPFKADSGLLACEPGDSPTFTTAAGTSVGLSEPDFNVFNGRVWAEDATSEAAARLRDEALALCD